MSLSPWRGWLGKFSMNHLDKLALTLFLVLADGKCSWEDVEPTYEDIHGSQRPVFCSIGWQTVLKVGAKWYQLLGERTQIAKWSDANHEVIWRKSERGLGLHLHALSINDLLTAGYRNRSFLPFFPTSGLLFSRTRVLPHFHSKFFWQIPRWKGHTESYFTQMGLFYFAHRKHRKHRKFFFQQRISRISRIIMILRRNIFSVISVISVWPLYSTQKGLFYRTQKTQKTQKLFLLNTDGTDLTDYSYLTSKNSEKPKKVSYWWQTGRSALISIKGFLWWMCLWKYIFNTHPTNKLFISKNLLVSSVILDV